MEKVTFVTTVYNEEETIETFLQSIMQQTRLPDEIIIVDAFSTDNTYQKIAEFFMRYKKQFSNITIQQLRCKGNRSVGRNFAIKMATYPIIAASDAGCILESHWLERISKPLRTTKYELRTRPASVVSGYYIPGATSDFQRCLAPYMCVMPDRVNPHDFLPSSRSIAFTKTAWASVGGYPEDIDTCEDLVFARNLKRSGAQMVFIGDAIVAWPQRKNIIAAFKQFYSYAYGDGQALYIRRNTPFLFGRYVLGLLLFIIAIATNNPILLTTNYLLLATYILWAFLKNIKYCPIASSVIYLPLLQFTADIAVMSGMTAGYYNRRSKQ